MRLKIDNVDLLWWCWCILRGKHNWSDYGRDVLTDRPMRVCFDCGKFQLIRPRRSPRSRIQAIRYLGLKTPAKSKKRIVRIAPKLRSLLDRC